MGERSQRSHRSEDELVDEASEESFPASDPPGYRSSSIGGPAVEPEARDSHEGDDRHK